MKWLKSPDSRFEDTATAPTGAGARAGIGVGVLIYSTGYGGADSIVLNWLKAIDRTRFRCHLFSFAAPEDQKDRFFHKVSEIGLTVHEIPWSRRKPLLRAAATLADYIQHFQLDIIHCHNPYADFVGLLAKRYADVITVNTFHAWGESGFRLQVLEQIDLKASRFFDQITAASEAARRGAVERGIPREKVKVLTVSVPSPPSRLSPEERTAGRAAFGAQPHHVVLISLARFYSVKRYDLMLQAFHRVLVDCPEAQLWMVGDGPEEAPMKQLAEQLGLGDRAKFLGYQTDVMGLLALADIQLLTSDIEGLPMAILEGMASGLPIVATKVGSLPEVLVHDGSALLVSPGDPAEVADAVIGLIENPAKRAALGQEAYLAFERRHGPRAGAASIETLYEDLVARRR